MPGEFIQALCIHKHVDKALTHMKHIFQKEEKDASLNSDIWIEKFHLGFKMR